MIVPKIDEIGQCPDAIPRFRQVALSSEEFEASNMGPHQQPIILMTWHQKLFASILVKRNTKVLKENEGS
ncbi:hypothetical protein LINPERHAP1_LOCUS6345 [Linum perenne]